MPLRIRVQTILTDVYLIVGYMEATSRGVQNEESHCVRR